MLTAVDAALPADIFIAAAAVADWRAEPAVDKIKKDQSGAPSLSLIENPDILASVSQGPRRPRLVVGFAAETTDLIRHAQEKLARKGCDLIVANDVSAGSGVFGGATNEAHLVSRAGVEEWPRLRKEEVAERLVARLAQMIGDERAP
jgi:phosphopantothenoylcysteine decarboxylase/phosphopantothenate--cysteine ligase